MMFLCKSCCIAIILAFLTINPDKFKVVSNKAVGGNSIWVNAGKMTGLILHSCLRLSSPKSPEHFMIILQDCLKRRSLLEFDRTLNRDIIELSEGVALVKYQQENGTRYNRALEFSKNNSKFDGGEVDWKSHIVDGLVQLFQTHVLKVHFKGLDGPQFEGRGRRKDNMFMQLMMFALVAAGLIVIPMMFQFLAILGGKALLLAKMALLLTSIQGLKKIATSNINYGLYSTHSQGPGPWHYDRQWPYGEAQGDAPYSYENHQSEFLHPRREFLVED